MQPLFAVVRKSDLFMQNGLGYKLSFPFVPNYFIIFHQNYFICKSMRATFMSAKLKFCLCLVDCVWLNFLYFGIKKFLSAHNFLCQQFYAETCIFIFLRGFLEGSFDDFCFNFFIYKKYTLRFSQEVSYSLLLNIIPS